VSWEVGVDQDDVRVDLLEGHLDGTRSTDQACIVDLVAEFPRHHIVESERLTGDDQQPEPDLVDSCVHKLPEIIRNACETMQP
jgi:hypothetical protein